MNQLVGVDALERPQVEQDIPCRRLATGDGAGEA
jgi:hypothetical protein